MIYFLLTHSSDNKFIISETTQAPDYNTILRTMKVFLDVLANTSLCASIPASFPTHPFMPDTHLSILTSLHSHLHSVVSKMDTHLQQKLEKINIYMRALSWESFNTFSQTISSNIQFPDLELPTTSNSSPYSLLIEKAPSPLLPFSPLASSSSSFGSLTSIFDQDIPSDIDSDNPSQKSIPLIPEKPSTPALRRSSRIKKALLKDSDSHKKTVLPTHKSLLTKTLTEENLPSSIPVPSKSSVELLIEDINDIIASDDSDVLSYVEPPNFQSIAFSPLPILTIDDILSHTESSISPSDALSLASIKLAQLPLSPVIPSPIPHSFNDEKSIPEKKSLKTTTSSHHQSSSKRKASSKRRASSKSYSSAKKAKIETKTSAIPSSSKTKRQLSYSSPMPVKLFELTTEDIIASDEEDITTTLELPSSSAIQPKHTIQHTFPLFSIQKYPSTTSHINLQLGYVAKYAVAAVDLKSRILGRIKQNLTNVDFLLKNPQLSLWTSCIVPSFPSPLKLTTRNDILQFIAIGLEKTLAYHEEITSSSFLSFPLNKEIKTDIELAIKKLKSELKEAPAPSWSIPFDVMEQAKNEKINMLHNLSAVQSIKTTPTSLLSLPIFSIQRTGTKATSTYRTSYMCKHSSTFKKLHQHYLATIETTIQYANAFTIEFPKKLCSCDPFSSKKTYFQSIAEALPRLLKGLQENFLFLTKNNPELLERPKKNPLKNQLNNIIDKLLTMSQQYPSLKLTHQSLSKNPEILEKIYTNDLLKRKKNEKTIPSSKNNNPRKSSRKIR